MTRTREAESSPPPSAAPLHLREPLLEDGPRIGELVSGCGVLEANSVYCYLLWCTHFRRTCRIAELGPDPAGFVAAYRRPDAPDTLFVWQVGVLPVARGHGVGAALLDHLVDAESARGLACIEATIEPENRASRRLFEALARRLDAPFTYRPGFAPEHFTTADATDAHPPEELLRIGPLG